MNSLLLLSVNDPLLPVSIAFTLLGLAMLVLGMRRWWMPAAEEPLPVRIRKPLRRRSDNRLDMRRRKTDHPA